MPNALKANPWRVVGVAVFAAFAAYVAVEPVLGSDDCISIGEILVLLPYYALPYLGTVPALIWVTVHRIARARRMSVGRKRDSNVAMGVLCTLLLLEAAAYFPSNYTASASRTLDFIPAINLALWFAKTWLYERVPQDVRS